ncbi:DUF3006 domain-containing protein [Deinococcus sp. YIM 134068]|uniref:DUF3006 domain-containing protein n=1 Tax=Deinococcus lichenicola TaxID=3118910 RepID=UPI002F93D0F9
MSSRKVLNVQFAKFRAQHPQQLLVLDRVHEENPPISRAGPVRYGAATTSGTPEPMLIGVLSVDAIEGGLARVELDDGEVEDWPLASLPRGVREEDVMRIHVHVEGGDLTVEMDKEATRELRQSVQAQPDALNLTAPVGEIDL